MRETFVNLVLGVLLALMIGWILVIGRPILLPLVSGMVLAYIVLGLAELFGRLPGIGGRLPALARYVLSLGLIAAVVALLVWIVIGAFGQIAASAPQYEGRLLTQIQAWATYFGFETEPTWRTLRDDVLRAVNLQRLLAVAVASASSLVATAALVVIYAGFMVAERDRFATKIARLSDVPARIARIKGVIADVNARIGAYLVLKTLINILLGSLSYAILRIAGVDFAGFWAILIGLVNYIPYLGSFIGVFFPTVMAVVQFGALGPVAALVAALSAAQALVGNFIEPWLMGNSLNLSPLVILVSLVVWTTIWGVPGAILAVPLMAILVIVLAEFPGSRPIAVLLSRDGDLGPPRGNG
ncbi:AI-2E family transporter [Amaricoccus sp.]|uniref:AI-2E family transporter n=1 Tax=Amaricoccus sp. TaxID=1872485 RepID=UPI001B51841E|nr:AI-2E family transporter [Amaricoccus sp.]MBP7241314.1 AI-2E family transporter [Amaricoccus sp.]